MLVVLITLPSLQAVPGKRGMLMLATLHFQSDSPRSAGIKVNLVTQRLSDLGKPRAAALSARSQAWGNVFRSDSTLQTLPNPHYQVFLSVQSFYNVCEWMHGRHVSSWVARCITRIALLLHTLHA